MWPLIALGGFSLLGQFQQNKSNARQAAEEAKAVQEANTKNFQRSLFRVGMLNLQKADELRQLTQRKADLGTQEIATAGSVGNNAAASGTVGASVDQVMSDVQMQFDLARAQVTEDTERTLHTFNMQLQDTIMGGQDSLQSVRKFKPVGLGEMLLNAGIQVGSTYAASRMNLGLGGGPGRV